MADIRNIVPAHALTLTWTRGVEAANRQAQKLPQRERKNRKQRESDDSQQHEDGHQLDEYI